MTLFHQHNNTPSPGGNRPFSLEVATWDIRHPPLRKDFICIATLSYGECSSHQMSDINRQKDHWHWDDKYHMRLTDRLESNRALLSDTYSTYNTIKAACKAVRYIPATLPHVHGKC